MTDSKKTVSPKPTTAKKPTVKPAAQEEAKTTAKTTVAPAKPAAKTTKSTTAKKTVAKPAVKTTAKPTVATTDANNLVVAKPKQPAVKKTEAPAASKKVPVHFEVRLLDDAVFAERVYLVGNVAELGAWDASKALELKLGTATFNITVELETSKVIEYKVCNIRDWSGVEKGMFAEELQNHVFTSSPGHSESICVYKWRS